MMKGLYGVLVFMFIGLGLILYSKHVPTSLPSRPDTGNHGQGHSPSSDCPKQYHERVDVDGVEFPLTCFGKIAYFTRGLNTQKQVYTEKTIVVYSTADDGLISDVVMVPSLPDYIAYICFRTHAMKAIQCLYTGTSKETSGMIIQKEVMADPEET